MPGGSYVHHADSFAMIRGGHLDLCVLGAFEVAANGDIANWATGENDTAPAVGGAMDLAVGRQAAVGDHGAHHQGRAAAAGARCGYPLTAPGAVSRVYTNLAVLDVTGEAFAVVDMAPGVTFDDLQAPHGRAAACRADRNARRPHRRPDARQPGPAQRAGHAHAAAPWSTRWSGSRPTRRSGPSC